MKSPVGFAMRLSRSNLLLGITFAVVVFIFVDVSWTNLEYARSKVTHMNQDSIFAQTASGRIGQNWTCIDRLAPKFNRVEDIFCIILPKFIPYLKNPCFYDYGMNRALLRCLPYFYIIGMDKCGSTDLHSRIVKHPFVTGNKGSIGKETTYWSWQRYGVFNKVDMLPKMSLEDYLDMFTDIAQIIEDTNITMIITGDATPMDLWDFRSWPTIPQNFGRKEPVVLTPHFLQYIHQSEIPKFIVQFREPIERLYSDYIFLEYGSNPLQFHNHCMEAIDMMNNCIENSTRRTCFFSSELYQVLPARIHLGCYSVFLKEWFNVFHRQSFLITTIDEYQNDMTGTLTKVFNFLNLPALPDFKMEEIINQTRQHVTQKKEGILLPETVTALRNFYDKCNKETAELLNDNKFLWLDHYL